MSQTKDEMLRELRHLRNRVGRLQRAEKALRESEERYRRLFEEDLTADYVLSPDGTILACNPAFVLVFGFPSREAALGSKVMGTFRSDADWEGFVGSVRREGRLERHECVRVRRDGITIDVLENAVGGFDAAGNLTEIKCYAFDNSLSKGAERALRESEDRYRRLFEEDLTGNYVATPDGRLLTCNAAFLELFGYGSMEEALGSLLADTHASPDGWERFVRLVGQCRTVQRHESERRHQDGREIHVVENGVGSFDAQGRLAQVHGYAYDDTERKRAESALRAAEQRYRSLVELIPDAVWVSDSEVIWFANPAAARLLGAETPGELVGHSLLSLFPAAERDRVVERTREAVGEGTVQPPERREMVRLDGKAVQVETTAAPCDFEGKRAVLRVSRDITARVRQEQEILRKDRELALHAQKVESLNAALRVLIEHREQELRQREEAMRATLSQLVLPHLSALGDSPLRDEQRALLEIVESNLKEISSSFARSLSTWRERLTPTEIRVADLLRAGKRTKDIAATLHVSDSAVAFHRSNIRAKLGLKGKPTNLVSFLRQMDSH